PWEPESLIDLLVYAFRGSDVDSVLVDGQILMREGRLLSLPEEEIRLRSRRSRERVLRRLGWI
ncbi:MAG: N-ethylammeline chlorohydrolase, partial [Anaerolineae bacterium]